MKHAILLAFTFLLTSCASKIYESPNLQTAIATHKTVAILPCYATLKLRTNDGEKIPSGQHADMEQKIGYEIQESIYNWFRNGKEHSNTVSIEDIQATNAKINSAKISYFTMQAMDRKDLAKILGVDAIIDTRLLTGKQISENRAEVNVTMTGFSGNTKETTITMKIYDGATGTLLWKYTFRTDDNKGSYTQDLIDKMLRKAEKKLPYVHH